MLLLARNRNLSSGYQDLCIKSSSKLTFLSVYERVSHVIYMFSGLTLSFLYTDSIPSCCAMCLTSNFSSTEMPLVIYGYFGHGKSMYDVFT